MRKEAPRHVASALSRRIVRGYPQPWRDRYEGEMVALLDDSPPRLRDVVDLARGLVVERVRATFEPGDRPQLTNIVLAAAVLAVTGAIMSVPLVAGWAARSWLGEPPFSGSATALFGLSINFAFLIKVWGTRLSDPVRLVQPLARFVSRRAAMVWFGAIVTVAFFAAWASELGAFGFMVVNALWLFAGHSVMPRAFGEISHTVLAAVTRLRAARHDLKWALMELDRCERLAAEGAASPLQEAREAIVRITHQRDEAMATLHSLGYRASLATGRREDAPLPPDAKPA